MTFDPALHHRRSVRLRGFDYTEQGAYFVTICAGARLCIFGEVVGGQMQRNDFGEIAHEEWWRAERLRSGIRLDAWVIMPNHVHGVVWLAGKAQPGRSPMRTALAPPPPRPDSLPALVRAYKSAVAGRINKIRGGAQPPVWQRGYYEHVVRDDNDLDRIREYIATNPTRWRTDPENPSYEPVSEEEYP